MPLEPGNEPGWAKMAVWAAPPASAPQSFYGFAVLMSAESQQPQSHLDVHGIDHLSVDRSRP